MSKADKMIEFLNKCHSVFHATALMEEELKEAGFLKLHENENWKLESNRYYYVMRNDTSIIAFKIPEILQVKSVNIAASHSDSPCLKVKPVATLNDPQRKRTMIRAYLILPARNLCIFLILDALYLFRPIPTEVSAFFFCGKEFQQFS